MKNDKLLLILGHYELPAAGDTKVPPTDAASSYSPDHEQQRYPAVWMAAP